ncbi:transposase [Streptomyces adustus]
MVVKNHPPEFKADAVALYQLRPGPTIRQVAGDLGINPENRRIWVRAAGASRPRGRWTESPAEPPTRWKRRTPRRKKVREPEEERETLQKSARYFAGETCW